MSARRPSRKMLVILVAIVLVVGAGVGVWWFSATQSPSSTNSISGTVQAPSYDVAALLSAPVATVHVEEGDGVAEGDTLVSLDDSALTLAVTQAQLELTIAKAETNTATASGNANAIAAAKVRQQLAQTRLSQAQLQHQQATVTAPHGGIVTTVVTHRGQATAPGRTLLTITDLDSVYVQGFLPEPLMGSVDVGDSVTISTDSNDSYSGTVRFISDTAEFSPNTSDSTEQRSQLVFRIRVSLDQSERSLKPGMPVDLHFS